METTTETKSIEAQQVQPYDPGTYDIRDPACTLAIMHGGEDHLLVTVDYLEGATRKEAREAVQFIASAPSMRATLDATALSLAEIEAAVNAIAEQLAPVDGASAAIIGLGYLREAVSALRATVEAV